MKIMLKKLVEKREELRASMAEILNGAKSENRAVTDEESAEFDRLESEIKAIDRTIKAEERARSIPDIAPENLKDNTANSTENTKKNREERAFADYILGRTTEMRSGEQNVDMAKAMYS